MTSNAQANPGPDESCCQPPEPLTCADIPDSIHVIGEIPCVGGVNVTCNRMGPSHWRGQQTGLSGPCNLTFEVNVDVTCHFDAITGTSYLMINICAQAFVPGDVYGACWSDQMERTDVGTDPLDTEAIMYPTAPADPGNCPEFSTCAVQSGFTVSITE